MPFMRVNGGLMVQSSLGVSMADTHNSMPANLGEMTPSFRSTITPPGNTGFLHAGQYKIIAPMNQVLRFGFAF